MASETHYHPEVHTNFSSARSNWVRAAVLGANDGTVSLAALVVGVAGVSVSAHSIFLIGVAGLLAGAFSMAVGEYVSVSSQRDIEHALIAKEKYELHHYAEAELHELAGLYEKKGLKPETAHLVAEELTANDAFAAHMDAELGIDPNNLTNPMHAAIASGAAFTFGAIIPIIAIVLPPLAIRIPVTFAAVLTALVLTGILSAKISGARMLPVTMRVVIGGILAMAITFAIGHLFNAIV
jgi:VIT1/CCC1 family predicted Fe2+/Mn2+ transporter